MKRIMLVTIIFSLLFAVNVMAASENCKINVKATLPGELTFTSATASGGDFGNKLVNGDNWEEISFKVNNDGNSFKVKYDGGQNKSGSNRRMRSGNNYLTYEMYTSKRKLNSYMITIDQEKPYKDGWGWGATSVTNYLYLNLPSNAKKGTYTDTVTMTAFP
jgi:spore coat protein U-like protein